MIGFTKVFEHKGFILWVKTEHATHLGNHMVHTHRITDDEGVQQPFPFVCDVLPINWFTTWVDLGMPAPGAVGCGFGLGRAAMERFLKTIEDYEIEPRPDNLDIIRVFTRLQA